MNYAGIKYCDIANGLGCRTVLFVSGCRNACKGCFQPQTWDFTYGECFDEQVQQKVLDSLKPEYIEGMTLLGGEPFEEENQEALLPFMKKVKSLYPDKNVWAFTGYIYDKDLILGGRKHTKDTDDLLSLIDVLVDGPSIEEQKDITLKFRGSVNQRILDLKKTMESGKIVKMLSCVMSIPSSLDDRRPAQYRCRLPVPSAPGDDRTVSCAGQRFRRPPQGKKPHRGFSPRGVRCDAVSWF